MRLVRRQALLASAVALVLACATAATATASPTAASKGASLCVAAKSVAKTFTIVPSTQTLSTAQGQAVLKSNLSKVVAAKSSLVSAAPGSLKPDVKKVIATYALLKKDLTQAHWNFASLALKPSVLLALEKAFTKSHASFNRVSRYFRVTCKY